MSAERAPETEVGGRYAWYVAAVLTLVYAFNFVDRQILSILNEDIKADLGLSDAYMGFLYGTAFAVFYAIFGIPLARLADMWVRKSLISVGLFSWSLMTALSGLSRSFGTLATFRIGVGIGESSASPAAFSILGDYFPPRLRATAVALYSSGVYLGAGAALFIGGLIVDNWNRAFPDPSLAPFGLKGWQAAYFTVGLPGLLMALWVWTLREPRRGMSEGLAAPAPHPAPFRAFGRELAAVLPPFTLLSLRRNGATLATLGANLLIAGTLAAVAFGLSRTVGTPAQWIALAIGLYAFFSWVLGIKLRDPAAFGLIYRCRTLVFGMIGYAFLAFVGYYLYFMPAYFQRVHGVSASQAGTILGLSAAIGGFIGVSLGGVMSDWLRRRDGKARLHMGMLCALLSAPTGLVLFSSDNVNVAYVLNFVLQIFSSCWIGSAVALANELVVPRMRATSSAYYILALTFIGLAMGPYLIGRISSGLAEGGLGAGEGLRQAMTWGLAAYGVSVCFLWLASRTVVAEEESRLARARALGEPA